MKYDGYQRALASMVYKFFRQKTESVVSVNKQLALALHKTVIKKILKRKFHFKPNKLWVDQGR